MKLIAHQTVVAVLLTIIPSGLAFAEERHPSPDVILQKLIQRSRELESEGNDEEAERVREQIRRMESQRRKPRLHLNSDAAPERMEIVREMIEVTRRIAELSQEGKYDEAGEMKAELARLKEELQEQNHRGQGRPQPERENEDARGELEQAHQRLQHVRAAAEHLEHAGMGDQARELFHLAERYEREVQQRERELQEKQRHKQHDDPARHLIEKLDALHNTVHEIQEEISLIRKELKSLKVVTTPSWVSPAQPIESNSHYRYFRGSDGEVRWVPIPPQSGGPFAPLPENPPGINEDKTVRPSPVRPGVDLNEPEALDESDVPATKPNLSEPEIDVAEESQGEPKSRRSKRQSADDVDDK